MSEFTDKLDAAGNKIMGNIKEATGKATGNEKLEAEGQAQEVQGAAQHLKGDVKGAIDDI